MLPTLTESGFVLLFEVHRARLIKKYFRPLLDLSQYAHEELVISEF